MITRGSREVHQLYKLLCVYLLPLIVTDVFTVLCVSGFAMLQESARSGGSNTRCVVGSTHLLRLCVRFQLRGSILPAQIVLNCYQSYRFASKLIYSIVPNVMSSILLMRHGTIFNGNNFIRATPEGKQSLTSIFSLIQLLDTP